MGLFDSSQQGQHQTNENVRRMIETQRSQGEQMTDWRDIETAPKDGTYILVYGKTWPGIAVARWRDESFLPTCWVMHPDGDGSDLNGCDPTHWMPLPEPPKED